jgi:hypothetical protein
MADDPGTGQKTSGRPNAVIDPEMNPSSQEPSPRRGVVVLGVFVAFSLLGLLVLFVL